MEALRHLSDLSFPDEDTLASIQELYDQGLYLKAFKFSSLIAPVETWRGSNARILAGRLCSFLGASRLGGLIHYIAWREYPDESKPLYYYARNLFRRRGAYATRKLLQRYPKAIASNIPVVKAEWLSFQAVISAFYRDFVTAEHQIKEAFEISPNHPWLHVEQSHICEREDRFEAALTAADKALELKPWFSAAIQQKAHVLQQLGRDKEAMQILQNADHKLESGGIAAQLLAIQMENNLFHDARITLARIEKLSPLGDIYFKQWLASRYSDVLYKLGEFKYSITYALEAENSYYQKIAENLQKSKIDKPAVLLPVTSSKTFDALDWLAQLVTHIPNKGESAGGGSDIMAIILISHVDYEKRPAPMIKLRP